ncbi:hypothetical protein FQZ97_801900 [compost metagenome]
MWLVVPLGLAGNAIGTLPWEPPVNRSSFGWLSSLVEITSSTLSRTTAGKPFPMGITPLVHRIVSSPTVSSGSSASSSVHCSVVSVVHQDGGGAISISAQGR